jgi:HAD superfamily hydrolase (TIGR01509 family)
VTLLTDGRATSLLQQQRGRSQRLPDTVAAVVFDCDGLLVDTEEPWHRAAAALLGARGLRHGRQHRALLTGRTLGGIGTDLAVLLGEDPDSLVAELLDRRAQQPSRPPRAMPGALRLVHRLMDRVPLAVASNSSRPMLEATLAAAGLTRCFPITVSADDVVRPKPDPLPYSTAFALLGVAAERVVAFEDSVVGATAARASGAFVVGVPSTPGAAVPADLLLSSLAARRLYSWASTLRRVDPTP